MPRFFFGNFDFEHRLADPNHASSTALIRLNAELATCWLAVAEDGDLVWTPFSIDPDFFHHAAKLGLPHVVPVTSLSKIPNEVEFVPWGWSAEVRKLANRFGCRTNAPSEVAVRFANSRATSHQLEQDWNIGLHGSRRIETATQFDEAIESTLTSDSQWVVKAEFGMSARERILGRGRAIEADKNWVGRRLKQQRSVFFEPWVERVDEVGIQIEIPNDGPPRLIGVSPMIVDERGQYAGSWFAGYESRPLAQHPLWHDAISTALRAATHLQSQGYFGPVGIDAMLYRDTDGSLRIRPLQDINARWTMGRLSLGLQRLIGQGQRGVWLHGPKTNTQIQMLFEESQIISTSPHRVGDEPCRHLSRIWISTTEQG